MARPSRLMARRRWRPAPGSMNCATGVMSTGSARGKRSKPRTRRTARSARDQKSREEHSMAPRIAIVGTGAVGGYVGAHLAQAGHDVVFIDMWPDNVEAIRATGLHITHLRNV